MSNVYACKHFRNNNNNNKETKGAPNQLSCCIFRWKIYSIVDYLGTVIKSFSFQTSKPNGKLFSGWYRPLLIASSLASSFGHAYETSFQRNFSFNFPQKPFWMHMINSAINKNLMYFILFDRMWELLNWILLR